MRKLQLGTATFFYLLLFSSISLGAPRKPSMADKVKALREATISSADITHFLEMRFPSLHGLLIRQQTWSLIPTVKASQRFYDSPGVIKILRWTTRKDPARAHLIEA